MTSLQELALLSHFSPVVQPRHLWALRDASDGSWSESLKYVGLDGYAWALTQLRASDRFRRWKDWMQSSGARFSVLGDEDYPLRWLKLEQPPMGFWYLGVPVWKRLPLLAVVGSRNPQRETVLWLDWHLRELLAERKIPVVSGGARGVDLQAHLLSIQSQVPTVAAMPVGLTHRYPPTFADLESEILACGGAIFSPFPPEYPLYKSNFARRNQLIAAMASLVFVAEARRRSGSMLTAAAAREMERPLVVLPGSPVQAAGLGGLDLIMEGSATLVRDRWDLQVAWDLTQPGSDGISIHN